MREILLTGTRQLLKALAVCTLLCASTLWGMGRPELIGGLMAGYATGLVWYGVMFGRLWRSADMTVSQAKQQVVVGAILRLLLMGAVFWAAIQVSFGQFLATVAGFGIVYVLGMVLLMLANRKLFRQ
ncbi:MAG: hypothetical protein IIX37_06260 [Selenomonadaceae bacterium]|uniref:hypothetical protein n=1 Tax=Anaerovibrio slackiae TaxID=2652309 RepID=UPI003F13E533|nr:hypothetical protein [Selenomonadaceae bacterium]